MKPSRMAVSTGFFWKSYSYAAIRAMEVPAATLRRGDFRPNGAAHDSPGQRPVVSRSRIHIPSPERATQPIPPPNVQTRRLSRLYGVEKGTGSRGAAEVAENGPVGRTSGQSPFGKWLPKLECSEAPLSPRSPRLRVRLLPHGFG